MIYLDTETTGLWDPILSIQVLGDEEIFHPVWLRPIPETLKLIEWIATQEVCAFNINFDWFQLTKWYNIFKACPFTDPIPAKVKQYEKSFTYCLKPKNALCLSIWARKYKYQYFMRRKPIHIKKIPKDLAIPLIEEIKSSWEPLPGLDFHYIFEPIGRFVNIKLFFTGSRPQEKPLRLKNIVAIEKGSPVPFCDDVFGTYTNFGKEWKPYGGDWIQDVYQRMHFSQEQIEYSMNDVRYLKELRSSWSWPRPDRDSRIACANATAFWRGFAINIPAVENKFDECVTKSIGVPIAPRATKRYLEQSLRPLDKVFYNGETNKAALQRYAHVDSLFGRRAKEVIVARKAAKLQGVLEKLLEARRLHVNAKSSGTLTNRQSGGSENKAKGGSINITGMDRTSRDLYTLASPPNILSGGDFDGYEVSIADSVLKDPALHAELIKGKKLHGLFAEFMYDTPYEEIMRQYKEHEVDSQGLTKYNRAKNSVFADMYWGFEKKIAELLDLPVEDVKIKLPMWRKKYSKLAEYREEIIKEHEFMKNYQFVEPENRKVASFFGFVRSFEPELRLAEGIYKVLESIDDSWDDGNSYIRFEKNQPAHKSVRSALWGTLFNVQSTIYRIVSNHKIQSIGAELTKMLEDDIWALQPVGANMFHIQMINIHDEIQVVNSCSNKIKEVVEEFIQKYRFYVPLLSITWKERMVSWGEK